VADHEPSKCKDLSSNPNTAKKIYHKKPHDFMNSIKSQMHKLNETKSKAEMVK
jgi:hypothetical protein